MKAAGAERAPERAARELGPGSRVYVAGHRGLVGAALVRRLAAEGVQDPIVRTRAELDLTRASEVERFFEAARPEYVFLAAARVGGILANATYPADFLRENLLIALNVLEAARRAEVHKLLFLGSSCIYPRDAPQPMREEYLLSGPLEPTNRPYALAKIAGLELCEAYNGQHGTQFISAMPTNIYGPGDNFDLASSHVVPALIRRFHEAAASGAPEVAVWGSGTPRRSFLHVDDLADACVFLMRRYKGPGTINVGSQEEVTIRALAERVAAIASYRGRIAFDRTKPDGTPRKLLDTSRLAALGWQPSVPLGAGLEATYAWYAAAQGQQVVRGLQPGAARVPPLPPPPGGRGPH
jgi:GDP-L-fucose synthase